MSYVDFGMNLSTRPTATTPLLALTTIQAPLRTLSVEPRPLSQVTTQPVPSCNCYLWAAAPSAVALCLLFAVVAKKKEQEKQ